MRRSVVPVPEFTLSTITEGPRLTPPVLSAPPPRPGGQIYDEVLEEGEWEVWDDNGDVPDNGGLGGAPVSGPSGAYGMGMEPLGGYAYAQAPLGEGQGAPSANYRPAPKFSTKVRGS
jgi:hypothetical protein